MSKPRKSWREKLADDKGFPQVCPIDETKSKRWGEGTFVIPAPREVDELMRRVPKGRLTTLDELRKALARKHGATIGCPITTGIFAWIAAHAAAEAESQGYILGVFTIFHSYRSRSQAAAVPKWRAVVLGRRDFPALSVTAAREHCPPW